MFTSIMMFKYKYVSLDALFPFLIVYWGVPETKVFYKNFTVHVYTNQIKLMCIKNLKLIDFTSTDSNTFLDKNTLSTYYTSNSVDVLSVFIYGVCVSYSRSFTQPIWEWYEREVSEKSNFLFFNLFDTRNLLQSYTLKLPIHKEIKPLHYPWVFTNNNEKAVNTTNSFRIIL